MRKTTVYLSEEEAEALRRASARLGISQSELIRDGVRRVTATQPRRVFRSRGVAGSGEPDVDADAYLDQHWAADLEAESGSASTG